MACVPYQPDSGLFITQYPLGAAHSKTAGSYTLVLTSSGVTVKQGTTTIYSHQTPNGYFTTYGFYGSNSRYLLVLDTYSDSSSVNYHLFQVDLAGALIERSLLNQSYLPTQNPALDIQPSPGNGLALFFFVGTSTDVRNLVIVRSDTGDVIC